MNNNKNRIYNLLTGIGIIAIVLGGILLSYNFKSGNLFLNGASPYAVAQNVKGNVQIVRKTVSYSLLDGTELFGGDGVKTFDLSRVNLMGEDFSLILEENSEVSIGENNFALKKGTTFITVTGDLSIDYEGFSLNMKNGSFALSNMGSTLSLYAFSGSATYAPTDISKKAELLKGQVLCISKVGDVLIEDIKISSLSDFLLSQGAQCEGELCFTKDEFLSAEKQRKDALLLQIQQRQEHEKELLAQGTKKENQPAKSETITGAQSKSTVSVSISCASILSNMDKLKGGKEMFVPTDGMILNYVTVEINEGETAYDVLFNICKNHGIQLECSWTPLYDSYYIEGINQLYPFDCGEGSGWVYRVNGWSPNYGISSCKLSDGDILNFAYTCDYGNDV